MCRHLSRRMIGIQRFQGIFMNHILIIDKPISTTSVAPAHSPYCRPACLAGSFPAANRAANTKLAVPIEGKWANHTPRPVRNAFPTSRVHPAASRGLQSTAESSPVSVTKIPPTLPSYRANVPSYRAVLASPSLLSVALAPAAPMISTSASIQLSLFSTVVGKISPSLTAPIPIDVPAAVFGNDDELIVAAPALSKGARRRRNKGAIEGSIVPHSPRVRTVLYWLRRDLRLLDNPALLAACADGAHVVPVFLWNLEKEERQGNGGADGVVVWLHHALVELNQAMLDKYGSHIEFRACERNYAIELCHLATAFHASEIHVTALYEPALCERDAAIFEHLRIHKLRVHLHHSYCLYQPELVSVQVFLTPFTYTYCVNLQHQGIGLLGLGSIPHYMACIKSLPPIGTPC